MSRWLIGPDHCVIKGTLGQVAAAQVSLASHFDKIHLMGAQELDGKHEAGFWGFAKNVPVEKIEGLKKAFPGMVCALGV